MFRDRNNERERAQFDAAISPYRNMGGDFEADDRLRAAEANLGLIDRHILTSNDRYQMSAAYLTLARNRTLVADAIVDAYTDPSTAQDLQGRSFSYGDVSQFLVTTYSAARTGLETADRIAGVPGFVASEADLQQLLGHATAMAWPQPEAISRHFLAGSVAALDVVSAYALNSYDAVMNSRLVPNDFKFNLKRRLQPLMANFESRRRAISRITGDIIGTNITSTAVMDDIYNDVQAAMHLLDEVSVWLTMPRAYERTFTLREPLDETRPERRAFDPNVLGSTATATVVQPPQARPSGRPFSPDFLESPTPQQPSQRDARPFDPNVLGGQPQEKAPSRDDRPFDPDILNP